MGYNGNNRGRTHNWSGVRNKRNYNWGLNLIAETLAAPFALFGALFEIADELGKQPPSHTSANYATPIKPLVRYLSRPRAFIETLSKYYSELSQRISTLSEKNEELLLLKKRLKNVRKNIFLLGKRKRIINALNYKILRKEQFISSFKIIEKECTGRSLSGSRIKGMVAVHFEDQTNNDFFEQGIALKKKIEDFKDGIHLIKSLAFTSFDWQIVFYNKGLILEDKYNVLFVPYKDIRFKETWIIHPADLDVHGYDIESVAWKYPRLDGTRDLRYSNNSLIHYLQRYQVELKFKKFYEDTSLYIIFSNKEDALALRKIISPRSKYDPNKIKTVKKFSYCRY